MSRSFVLRAAALFLLVGGAAGCRDQLPTAIGPDRFPQGTLLTSLVMDLEAADFLEQFGVFDGYAGPRDQAYNLVANDFEGSLRARTLFRLDAFPVTVAVPVLGDTIRSFSRGEMVARFDSAASLIGGNVTLRLHALAQPWDAATTTWTLAADTAGSATPWSTPGGAVGVELARVVLTPGDTVGRDSVRFPVDSLALERMRAEGFPGVIVLADGAPSRIQVGQFQLRAQARPTARPDTLVTVNVAVTQDVFILTPESPPLGGDWVAGGISAARSVFRVSLPERLRACPPGTPAGSCPERPLREVILNEVVLQLRPVPVGGGFRPLAPLNIGLRVVAEPELGRQAPLGPQVLGRQVPGLPPIFAAAQVQRQQFVPGATADTTVFLVLTDHFRNALLADTAAARVSTAFALLQEPEGATFGQARFRPAPRLRIVYTLPVQQTSP
jgi:hypothetical protein